MKTIDILSKDSIYSEMLASELEEQGYSVNLTKTPYSDLSIIDLDSIDYTQAENTITFSRTKEADLQRPFEIERFLELVSDRTKENQKFFLNDSKALYLSSNGKYVIYDNNQIELSELEYKLLHKLYKNPGKIISTDELSKEVFNEENNSNLVRVYISYLREKLDNRFKVKIIITVRNKGYMLSQGENVIE